MGLFRKKKEVIEAVESQQSDEWYKYNCMEGVPNVNENTEYVEEDDEEDYDDSVFDDEPAGHPFRTAFITLVLFAVIGYSLFYSYNKYMDVFGTYSGNVNVEDINKAYLEVAENLQEDGDNCMYSPLGIDISVTQHAVEEDITKTQQRVLVNQFNRGYRSWDDSLEYMRGYSENEIVSVFDVSDDINSNISSVIGEDYELEEDMLDADKVVALKVGSDFKARTSKTLTELFLEGDYFKNEASFRVLLKDNDHELIFYRDEFPDDDWEHVNGVLSIPLNSYTFTSSMQHSVKGLRKEEVLDTKIVQVIKFPIDSEIYTEESPDYTHRVGTPYNIALRNRETGIIVACGKISGSTGE